MPRGHAIVQARQDPAGCGFASGWNERMDKRGTSSHKKPKPKTDGKAHVLKVAFINRCWVIEEELLKWSGCHGVPLNLMRQIYAT